MSLEEMCRQPTHDEIRQFLDEFDRGEHQLTERASDALATAGFRHYLGAMIEVKELRSENDRLAADLAASKLDGERGAMRAMAALERELGGAGWPNTIRNRVARIINCEMNAAAIDAARAALRAELAQARAACPCKHTTPCSDACSCANPVMSGGCERCCAYGSEEQQRSEE